LTDARLEDPLGRRIVLHDRTWFGHILKAHPEMDRFRAYVEQALTAPDEVRFSAADEHCRLYFGPGPRSDVIMMVVADMTLGVVKTAHLARKPSGGPLEWSK